MLTGLAAVGRSRIGGLNAPRSPLGRCATWRSPRRWATAVGAVPKKVATMVAEKAAMANPPRPPVWILDPLPNAVPLWTGDARKMPQTEANYRRPPTIREVMCPEGPLPPRQWFGSDGE